MRLNDHRGKERSFSLPLAGRVGELKSALALRSEPGWGFQKIPLDIDSS
jgi:hypothetical protein